MLPTPFIRYATRSASAISSFVAPSFIARRARPLTPPAAPSAASKAIAMRSFTFFGKAPSAKTQSSVVLMCSTTVGSIFVAVLNGLSGMAGLLGLDRRSMEPIDAFSKNHEKSVFLTRARLTTQDQETHLASRAEVQR